MKNYTCIAKLISYEHLNCSIYGNPRYSGVFETTDGVIISGKTASDASCGYSFLNYRNAPRKITYHITRAGNIIFDYITPLVND